MQQAFCQKVGKFQREQEDEERLCQSRDCDLPENGKEEFFHFLELLLSPSELKPVTDWFTNYLAAGELEHSQNELSEEFKIGVM